jgi:hypothetical protein
MTVAASAEVVESAGRSFDDCSLEWWYPETAWVALNTHLLLICESAYSSVKVLLTPWVLKTLVELELRPLAGMRQERSPVRYRCNVGATASTRVSTSIEWIGSERTA